MAEQGFNVGPNATPGGAPEDPRVNNAALNAELKQAQLLQAQTIKSLTETIEELQKQYAELTGEARTLSNDEKLVTNKLREKIETLTQILKSMQDSMAKGEPVRSLASIGQKERIQTFDKLTAVISQYQKSNLEFMKSSQGQSLDFDSWYEGFLEQQKVDLANLEASEYNGIVLEEIKKILKASSTDLAKVSDPELEELAKQSLKLSVDEKRRDLEFYEQNRDIIKLNREANIQEQENVRKLVASNQFDPSKPILEHGFKSVSKDMDKLIQNTKHRSLIKIISDLLGPFGPIIMGLVKFVVLPLMFALGLFGGVLVAQYLKLRALGNLLTLAPIKNFIVGIQDIGIQLKAFKIGIERTIFHDLPEVYRSISEFAKRFKFRLSNILNIFADTEFAKRFEMVPAFIKYLFDTGLQKITQSRIGTIFSGLFKFIGQTGKILGNIGSRVLSVTNSIAGFFSKVFEPITTFFKSGTGRLVVAVDGATLGIFRMIKFGFQIGKTLAGIAGPIATVMSIFEGLPALWSKLTSGDLRTAIKGALALITQITAQALATIFGGPVGGIAAAMTLNFERIYRWFEPLFDLILDVGEVIFGVISSVYKDFVEPIMATITKVLVTLMDSAFKLINPVIKSLRILFLVLSYTIIPLIKAAFKVLGFVLGKLLEGALWLYDHTIGPVIDGISGMFNYLLDNLESVIKGIVGFAIDLYNKTVGKVFGKMENPFETSKAKTAPTPAPTAEKPPTETLMSDTEKKDWFNSLSTSVTEGVSDAVGKGKEMGGAASESIKSLVDVMKEHTEAVKQQTEALANSPLGMKIRQKGLEGLEYATTPISNQQMQYAASPQLAQMSQQEMMNAALGFKGKAGDTVVNNVVTNNTSGSGGGGFIPMVSSGHMDPTKVALQISYRPPG
jgi:hypothetical protein